MARFAMAIDLTTCIGCYNCQVACKDEHVGNDFSPLAKPQPTFGHFWLSIDEKEQVWNPSHIKVTYIPKPCQHCADAPCVKSAEGGSMYQRPDGIVIIDPDKAIGRKELVSSCPYGSIYLNEELDLPQKCTFCAHLLDDHWQEPRCVQSCPTNCMYFGDLDDPASKVSQFLAANKAESYHPEYGTRPRVYYIGLPKPHLSGTIRFADDGECAADVTVTLAAADGAQRTAVTDSFGDFEFRAVAKGACRISFELSGYQPQTRQLDLDQDITDLGEVVLQR